MFLSNLHLSFLIIVCVAGIFANALSIYHLKKNFDTSKTLFRVLLFDGACSIIFRSLELVFSTVIFFAPRSEFLCSAILLPGMVSGYHGLIVAFELAVIRYLRGVFQCRMRYHDFVLPECTPQDQQ